MHDAIAAHYPDASHTLTGQRQHSIHMAQPDLVAEAITSVIERTIDPVAE